MNDNPQYIRTDRAIVGALISLLRRKPFEKITVQDILDEAPVTRATFYAHYRDKYDIAEKMLAHFLDIRNHIRQELATASNPSLKALRNAVHFNLDYTEALLKIHTEKVDFRRVVADELEREYIRLSSSPTREIEARVYAQAYIELYLALLDRNQTDITIEDTHNILIPVAIRLLHLPADEETAAFFNAKVAKIR